MYIKKHSTVRNEIFFDDFLNTFWRFPKIPGKLSEGQTTFSDHFLKIAENFQR